MGQERAFSGFPTNEVREYEIKHRQIVRHAASQCFVLLKNENRLLPIPVERKIALYGEGALHTVKGGTGSGEVNSREVVTIYQGLKNAGYTITTERWLLDTEEEYQASRMAYRQEVIDKVNANHQPIEERFKFFAAYRSTPYVAPMPNAPEPTDTDTAVFVISRVSGEGKDRSAAKGDYYLSDGEDATLSKVCVLYPHVVVVINTGGLIDLSFLDRFPQIEGVLYIHQPGQEVGNAFADVLSGKTTPSGKLTDTWAYDYWDYPSSAHFSHNDDEPLVERYEEGIYVGYRYFDTFDIPVRYGFGYGLSYTTFDFIAGPLKRKKEAGKNTVITFTGTVTNTGLASGREVIQLYASCPQEKMAKEYRRLIGFAKTALLKPGQSEEITVSFDLNALTSFSESVPGWVLEAGVYGLFAGNSLKTASVVGSVLLDEDILVTATEHVCPLQEDLCELEAPADMIAARRNALLTALENLPAVTVGISDVQCKVVDYTPCDQELHEDITSFVETLSVEELVHLATGEITAGSGDVIGSSGVFVPGSGGQTTICAVAKGIPSLVMADGPAGLRLLKQYTVTNGEVLPIRFEDKFQSGFFARDTQTRQGETWYQYCTAIPCGTALAMSWDPEVGAMCGEAVAEEMKMLGVHIWLAPGMNIHRDPLCGRNFEYFSEDPLISGVIARAIVGAVEAHPGLCCTMKHFACNNAEDNRTRSDSILSERTLREMYLKGFEIALKTVPSKALMTSYNKINGIHTANSYDLCTKIVRSEWNYAGLLMTDWTITQQGAECTASGCMRAGNDLIMPGSKIDHDNLYAELKAGTLSTADLMRSVGRLVRLTQELAV